jgi:hypothetical protein
MIPKLVSSRGFSLRKLGGTLTACAELFTSSGGRLVRRPSLLGVVGLFAAVVMPLLMVLLLVAAALTRPHAGAGLGLLPLVAGATTGTKSSGTDFVGLNDMLKTVYTKSFENNVEKDEEVSDLITKAEGFEVHEGPDGKSINMNHDFSSGGGVGSMLEDDYLYTPTVPTSKQSSITIKQHIAVVQLSGRTLRRVKKGPAAFVTWATEALPRKARRLAFHKDRQRLGTGTGIIARYNGAPDGTGDPLDNMFGISGLDDRAAMLLLRDDNLRCGPNADGSSLRTGTALVGAVTYSTNAINTTVNGSAGAPTSAADNDYLFLGDANVNGSGAREMMGLEGIIDDGTNLTAFQGITTRTDYPELCAQVVDATANGFDGTLSEELLDYADSLAFERGNMGRPQTVLVNRSGQRSFWKNMKNDRVLNDPRGVFQGGKTRLKMMLGDRIVNLAAGRKVPASRCYGIDGAGIQRFKIGSGRWDDTDGAIWNRVVDSTGRKDAFFAVYVEEEEMGAGNPAASFKITSLAAA